MSVRFPADPAERASLVNLEKLRHGARRNFPRCGLGSASTGRYDTYKAVQLARASGRWNQVSPVGTCSHYPGSTPDMRARRSECGTGYARTASPSEYPDLPPRRRELGDPPARWPARLIDVDIFRHLDDRGLKKIGLAASPTPSSAVPGAHCHGGPVSPGEQVGARVQRPKRVPKRGKNLPMSCANVTEVQVDLRGRIHP